MIKSQIVHSSSDNARAIPFRPVINGNSDQQNTLAWTVEQAQLESVRIVEKAKQYAFDLKSNAKQKADSLLTDVMNEKNNWEEEKRSIQQEAYEKAFGQGYEEGREKGYTDLFHSLEEAKEIVSSAKEALHEQAERNEQVILQLAIGTAEKILAQTLEQEPERFLQIVKKAIKEVREMKEVKIYTAVPQYALLHKNREELIAVFPIDVQLSIYPEDELEPNQCFIETTQGRIDLSIDSQLTQLKLKLSQLLSEEEL
ncbi:flagellar assembly protein FliH [Jeotgalibacillus sp. ET6]|uniref:flagellar assembly protein FliH n=1 Tax=Jeotgalibacillus sp. ET6 TaxID=3037260 RepID=UPI0024182461|nr:flagellar assembly protein FliH [Jeotgalibacillus sp. ET6]MDG5470288.1 flagellar assembly protein FliH [Jeotgalibacillus sp. ET6]